MPSLKDVLAAQKLKKENVNVPSSSTSGGNSQSGSPQIKTAEIAKQVEKAVETNRPAVQQEKPAVVAKGLSLRERLAAKTVSQIQKETPKPPIVYSPGERQAVAQVPSVVIGEKDAEKTNDGNADLVQLRANLSYLANNIEQKELVGQVVRTIATQLKNRPELTPYMADKDVDLVVRGLRRAYNVAARKKQERRDNKASKSAVELELDQAFKDAGLKL